MPKTGKKKIETDFQLPWLRYRIYTPHSEGAEWLLRITYKPSKSITTYAQYREETKDRNVRGETVNYQVAVGTKRNVWLHADFRIGALDWKSRIQYSRYAHTATTDGWAFIQEVSLEVLLFLRCCCLACTERQQNLQPENK